MSLSVLCITRGPGPRVAALLELLRPTASEIVVAADAKAGAEDVRHYAAFADRVVRFPHDGTERHLAWAHELCSREWILRIDDDEVPSAALLARLPNLATERTVDEIWIPQRWLTTNGEEWLAEPPWWPEAKHRLIRRDADLRFSGVLHTAAETPGPALWIREPFYHLDLTLNDFASRRAKARRYLTGSLGRQAPGGGDIGAAYYLPERRAGLKTASIPEVDRELIARVRHPGGSGAVSAPRATIETVTQADVDRAWVGRSLTESSYRGRFEIVAAPERLPAGAPATAFVNVANHGSDRWERALDGPPFIRIGHRWHHEGEEPVVEGPRAPLPRTLLPGQETLAPVPLTAPLIPGDYRLEVGMVHEGVCWFGPPVTVAVSIAPGEQNWSFSAADLPAPVASNPRRGLRDLRRRRPTLYLGWVNHGNLGDEAIYEIARRELKEVQVAPTDVDPGKAAVASSAILGGGTLIGHAEYREGIERLLDADPALPTGTCGTGVEDPDYRPDDAPMIRAELARWVPLLERMTTVSVRGPHSRALLAEYGLDVSVTGDPALLLGPSDPPPPQEDRVLGINGGVAWRIYGRQPDLLLDQLAETARVMAKDGWQIRLISVWQHDVGYLHELARRAGVSAEVHDCRTVDDALDVLRSCRLFVGMKLHSVVFASALSIPAVMLSYQPKCDDFMASIGRERLSLRTDDMIADEAVEALRALDARFADERAELHRSVDVLRDASRRHFQALRLAARA